jgi:cell division protein DivIC
MVRMMSNQQSRFGSFLYGLLPLLIAAIVLLVLIAIGERAVQNYEMQQEAKTAERRVEQLKKENQALNQQLEYYRSDQYIEKMAREELGLVRPGDVAVAIVGTPGTVTSELLPTPTPFATPGPSNRDKPNWQRWLSLFTGRG